MSTEFERSLESLILIFHRYAIEDGDGKLLSKKELKKLIETELPSYSSPKINPKLLDGIMKDLDYDKDDKLTFEEFIPLFTGLSIDATASAAMTADLEVCLYSVKRVFHHYAVPHHGDGKFLSKKELKKLIDTELPNFKHAQENPKVLDCIMKDLDHDKDDKLNFKEFVPLFTGLSIAGEKFYNLQQKKCKK